MKRALLSLNGEFRVTDYLLSRLPVQPELVIGVDGGGRHLRSLGLVPHHVVGDMDSIDPDLLDDFRAQGAALHRFPPEKDQTDLELALAFLGKQAISSLSVIGAGGGRVDHTLALFGILNTQVAESISLAVIFESGESRLIRTPGTYRFPRDAGTTISLLPLGGRCEIQEFSGVQWPMTAEVISAGSGRTLSNKLLLEEACLIVSDCGGGLLVHQEAIPDQRSFRDS